MKNDSHGTLIMTMKRMKARRIYNLSKNNFVGAQDRFILFFLFFIWQVIEMDLGYINPMLCRIDIFF